MLSAAQTSSSGCVDPRTATPREQSLWAGLSVPAVTRVVAGGGVVAVAYAVGLRYGYGVAAGPAATDAITLWWTLAVFSYGGVAVYSDTTTRRVPNAVTLRLALWSAVAVAGLAVTCRPGVAAGSVVAGLAAGAFLLAVDLVCVAVTRRRGFGGGDIKLVVSLAAYTCWLAGGLSVSLVLLLAVVLAITDRLVRAVATRSTAVFNEPHPFAPSLVFATAFVAFATIAAGA